MTRWPTWFDSSVWMTPRTPVTTAIAIIPPAFHEIVALSWCTIAFRTRRNRNAGTTPRAAVTTISARSPDRRRQYGLNSGPMRRRLARRTAGSAGRSAGASLVWKNMPIAIQGTPWCMIEDVRVTVRLFAGLRERAGTGRLELDDVERVADIWSRLGLGDEPGGLLYAVNREYVDRGATLADGDEVAVIPPVSGGAFLLSAEPLDLGRVVAEAASDDAGAVATFVGTVRRHSRGREVERLEYEAIEEMAEPMLHRLAAELTEKHGLCEVAIHHRVGAVDIGEPSVVIAVSAPHRAAALDACREAIDTLKETIPLWKKEIYADGEEWIGRGS